MLSLITQRSQVQILPPLPEKVQVKGLVTGNGTRPLVVLDRSLTAAGRWRTPTDVTGLTQNGPSTSRVVDLCSVAPRGSPYFASGMASFLIAVSRRS